MKALQVRPPGGPHSLHWTDLPEPVPGPGEVAVRVTAGSVSWADLLIRDGRYPGGPAPPFVSGHDLAGVVVGLGEGAPEPPIGTRVWAVLGWTGAFAEIVVGPAWWFHPIPPGMDLITAAAIGAGFLTADTALVTVGRLQEGETVLVHAAAGGVGSCAVQLARAYGAGLVIGTCGSASKAKRVIGLGADHAVDYTSDDFVAVAMQATHGRGVDLVLEAVGGEILGKSFDCLTYLGRLVSYGAVSLRTSERFRLHTLLERSVIAAGFTLQPMLHEHRELLEPGLMRVQQALDEGAVHPLVGAVVPACRAADAFRAVAERAIIGRAVIDLTAT